MTTVSDNTLLQAFVHKRSQDAFTELAQRHTSWIHSAALRMVREPHLAEDVTQAVFILLARKSSSLLNRPALTPWLFTVTRYAAAQALRARTRRLKHEAGAAAMTPTAVPPPPDQDWPHIAPLLEALVARLRPNHRDVILLRFYQQKPFAEIGAALNISEDAARKRVAAAIDKLRSLFERHGLDLSAASLAAPLLAQTTAAAPSALTHACAAILQSGAVQAATAGSAALPIAKGAAAMMFAKTTAVVAAATLLVAVPAAIALVRHVTETAPPAPQLVPLAAPADPAQVQPYILQPDRAIAWIPPPFPAARSKLLEGRTRMPKSALFEMQDNTPVLRFSLSEDDWPFGTLVNLNLSIINNKIEDNPKIWETKIPGDFVYREGAPEEVVISDLKDIARRALKKELTIEFRDVERRVVVIKGKWRYTPVPRNQKAADAGEVPVIELYGDELSDPPSGGAAPTSLESSVDATLGNWIRQDVFSEATDVPPQVRWQSNLASKNPHDKALTLKHFTEQTGLTITEETRTVRHLIIEPAPAAAAPLDDLHRIYGLKENQYLALVPDVPPEVRAAVLNQLSPGKDSRPDGLIIQWNDDKARVWAVGSDVVPLHDILGAYLGIYPQQLDAHLIIPPGAPTIGHASFPDSKLPAIRGDLVIRDRGTPEQYRAALETILRECLHQPVTLTFRDVDEPAVVLKGKWAFTQLPAIRRRNVETIEIFAETLDVNRNGGIMADGSPAAVAGSLGAWLHQPVVFDAENLPSILRIHIHSEHADEPRAHNPALILNHVTEQTSLTWTIENRPIRHLFIDPAPPAPAK